jgi:multidrug resistance efflux pump
MTALTQGRSGANLLRSLRDKPLSAIGLVLASLTGGVLVWGFFGTLRSEVSGTGMIVRGNHLYVVNSQQQGVIKSQRVKLNDRVRAGDVLMSLDASQQQIQIRASREQLAASIPLTRTSIIAGKQLEITNLRLLQQAQQAYANQAPSLKIRIEQQEKAYRGVQALYKSGVVSASDLSSTFDELTNLKSELIQLAQAVSNSKAAYEQIRQQNAGNSFNLVQQNANLVSGLKGLDETVNQAMFIRSPVDGTVAGFEVTVGNYANPGDPLITIMPSKGPLRAIILVGSNDFQRINVGDDVLLSPTATPAVRFGYIKGKVLKLAKAPASQGELMKAFGSSVTVQSFLGSFNSGGQVNLPYLVDVAVEQDKNGQPVWTLGNQPPWGMRPGTPATARIVSDKTQPISLILPFLRGL